MTRPPGGRDLQRLLDGLSPRLSPTRYAFDTACEPALDGGTFALVREDEGITVIRASEAGEWARITLQVNSSLEAVGLTAAFSTCLAGIGISANVVAALHHDHIFVPWSRREEALAALRALACEA